MIPRSLGLVALVVLLGGSSLGCETRRADARPNAAEEHRDHGTHSQAVPARHAAPSATPEHAEHQPAAERPSEPGDHAGHAQPASSASDHTAHPPAAAGASGSGDHAEHAPPSGTPPAAASVPAGIPDGYSGFTLDLERARNVGLTTATVTEQNFTRSLRTVGVVTLDETRTSHVHAKVRGFIESISVDFVGKAVRRGQPLITIYSQEVYAAELEFLSVLEQPAPAAITGEFASAERKARELLLAGARRRLSLWDVARSEIERLEQTRTPKKTFTLASPRAGIVLAKQALAGMFIDPSVELYLISDIRKLWVLADVYGTDVPFLKLGSSARLQIEGTLKALLGKVAFIPPTVDEATRTLKVRFEIDNPDGRIRPGAFGSVEMDIGIGRGLGIPEDAVVHAGPRAIVFVVAGDRVEPRQVVLGPNIGGRYRVEKGLKAGERVATGAQFLLDSESRLRASSAPGGAHGGH